MSLANTRQVAGSHYASDIQHWDVVVANELDYFQGQITKYVMRWKKKNGVQDLKKAQHFLEKYIEVSEAQERAAALKGQGYEDAFDKQFQAEVAASRRSTGA